MQTGIITVNKARFSADLRCRCGRLLARWEGKGLVIKCIRCGNLVSIPYNDIQGVPPGKF